ncbi:TPA: hypothetical protein ACIVAT_000635 [Salmonella enterica subsp. enterica serovar Waycross]
MAKHEVIAKGIFVKEGGKVRELEIGEIISDAPEQWLSKLRTVSDKVFEVATPEPQEEPKKRRREKDDE